VDTIPKPGETVLGEKFTQVPGGKGANQAVAAARADGAVVFIACVGNDLFGDQFLEGFRQDKIRTEHIHQLDDVASGVALIFVERSGENSIAVASGANARLAPEHIQQAEQTISKAQILVLQLEIPMETVSAAVNIAAKHNVPVLLNPAPAQPLDDQLLRQVTFLTPNESEAELLTGVKVSDQQSALEAGEKLLDQGVEGVIITLGAKGVFVAHKGVREMLPGFQVEAVDTTAAGDVFNGALAVALSKKMGLLESVNFANAAAALSVTKLGAQPSAPSSKEIKYFLDGNIAKYK